MKHRGLKIAFVSSVTVLLIIVFIVFIRKMPETDAGGQNGNRETQASSIGKNTVIDPFLTSDAIAVDYLTPNDYSRPGKPLNQVNAVVIHYVGNPGTTAAQNRSYFEGLKDNHATSASSHYIIGLDGEIIQCVPLDEISYASNDRNKDTISIECCHPDASGKFRPETYRSLVKLTAALCRTYGLSPDSGVIRHYDVTGKRCPLYYVDHEEEWYEFKLDVKNEINGQKDW